MELLRISDSGSRFHLLRLFRLTLPAQLAFLVALLLCSHQALAACAAPSALEASVHAHPTAGRWEKLGDWFDSQNDFGCAARALQSAVTLDPTSAHLNYFLGLAFFKSGDYTDAIPPFQHAAAELSLAIQPHFMLASSYMSLDQWKKAQPQWRTVLKLDPGNPAAVQGLSHCFIQLGDSSADIQLLQNATLTQPLAADLATAYTSSGHYNKALATLKAALQRHPAAGPANAPLRAMMAWVLLMDKQPAAALPIAQQADTAAPTLPVAQISLGRALLETGHPQSSVRVLKTAAKQEPNILEIHTLLAHAYAAAGRSADAQHQQQLCASLAKSGLKDDPASIMDTQAPLAQ